MVISLRRRITSQNICSAGDHKRQKVTQAVREPRHKRALRAFTIVSHQALLDVADIGKKVADCRDLEENRSHVISGNRGNLPAASQNGDGGSYPRSAGGRDEVVAPLVAQFDAMPAEARHAA